MTRWTRTDSARLLSGASTGSALNSPELRTPASALLPPLEADICAAPRPSSRRACHSLLPGQDQMVDSDTIQPWRLRLSTRSTLNSPALRTPTSLAVLLQWQRRQHRRIHTPTRAAEPAAVLALLALRVRARALLHGIAARLGIDAEPARTGARKRAQPTAADAMWVHLARAQDVVRSAAAPAPALAAHAARGLARAQVRRGRARRGGAPDEPTRACARAGVRRAQAVWR
jgi:hypothetical protein